MNDEVTLPYMHYEFKGYKAEEFEFLDGKYWFIVKEVHFQLMMALRNK